MKRLPSVLTVVVLLLCMNLPRLDATESSRTLDDVLSAIRDGVLPDEAMELMRRVYSTDRWFTFPKFHETAEYLKGAMEAAGLYSVEVEGPMADGVTQAGFWTEPLAWDVKEARLLIVDPPVGGETGILADYHKVPTSVCEWSGPTPPGGIMAEVADISKLPAEKIARLDLHGKLALTDQNPAGIKWALVRTGALGAINAFTENPSLLDGRQWINAWGDNGWAFIKGSTPLVCFSITPRETALLRRLLSENSAVRVKATVESRYYSAIYPYVTAVIPGTTDEEVLLLGHTSEQGAEDNATGVAALVEAMATLRRLIAAGKLPTPRRTIRILTTPEMYGSMGYIEAHGERIRRTIAAMCLDSPAGQYDLAGTEYTFYTNPEAAASFTDAFILKVADAYFSALGRPWHWHPYMTGTDSYLGEPTIGVPTVWAYSGSGVETHHNSEDTPGRADPRSLRDITIVVATYIYYLADAGQPEAIRLAHLAQAWGYQRILDSLAPYLDSIQTAHDRDQLGRLLQQAFDQIDYSLGRQSQAVNSVLRLVPEGERQQTGNLIAPLVSELAAFGNEQKERVRTLVNNQARLMGLPAPVEPVATSDPQAAAASGIVVKRRRVGTIPLDEIPPDQREGYPSGAWAAVPIAALYWCDGRRNLAEVIHLTRMELGPTKFDFVGYFRFLRKHGYVEFAKCQ